MEKVKGGNYVWVVKEDMTVSQMSAEMVCALPPDGVKYVEKPSNIATFVDMLKVAFALHF